MKDDTQDNRPKIIDYQKPISDIQITVAESLLWPCNAFKISLPVRKKRELNIFEETILKLVATGRREIRLLSQLTCLKPDFIGFILSRLQQHKLLSDRNEATENGKNYIAITESEVTEYTAATVFIDLIGGNILPFIGCGDLKFEQILKIGIGFVLFKPGSATQVRPYFARKLRWNYDYTRKYPNSREISEVGKIHSRLRRQYSLLSDIVKNTPVFYGRVNEITVSTGPELVFFHVKIIIPKGSVEYRITDPFGYGFSDLFECSHKQYIKSNPSENERVTDLKRKSRTERIIEAGKINKRYIIKKIPGIISLLGEYFINPEDEVLKLKDDAENRIDASNLSNKSKSKLLNHLHHLKAVEVVDCNFSEEIVQYEQIYENIINAEEQRFCFTGTPKTSEEEKAISTACLNCASFLYAATEWTFRQVITDYPSDKWEGILINQDFADNCHLISELARKIGFYVDKRSIRILQVPPGKILAIGEGSVELSPLLALSIAEAAHNPVHPLHGLVLGDRDFLNLIADLKHIRDADLHGEMDKRNLSIEQINAFCERIYSAIKCLLPKLKGGKKFFNTFSNDYDDIFEKRLKARIELDKYFGIQAVDIMDSNYRELMIQIEIQTDGFKENSNEPAKCTGIINNLSSIVQIVLYRLLQNSRSELSIHEDLVKNAEIRAAKTGLLLENKQLPESLRHINLNNVKRSCEGRNNTLGANLLALLLIGKDDFLYYLSRTVPNIIELAGKLCHLREHGNQRLELPAKTILTLKNNVYQIIKQLGV